MLYFFAFQIRPQTHFDEHDGSAEFAGHPVLTGPFLRAVCRREAGHGFRFRLRGVCCLRPIRGTSWREVGDHRRSVQLLLVACGVPDSHSVVPANAQLEGSAIEPLCSRVSADCTMVQTFQTIISFT